MDFTHDKAPKKNMTGITIVIIFHIIVGYGIVSGLGKRMVAKLKEEVETKIIEEVKPPPPKEVPPPPPPPETKAPPPPFIPPVEVQVANPPPVQNTISQTTSQRPATTEIQKSLPQPTPAPKSTAPVHIPAVVDFSTCAKPEWPKSSLRNEETGTVTLKFLIGVDGRVVEAQIVKSSGFRDLDKAAVVGISKCKFKPGTTDGKAEQSWSQMQYVWTLE
ncbi:energy transducer TonB [Massilia sp. TS11]|uniref:energy transducer TonB n=1 Tax=Massilia sp. TS11 TaxID=2908003 RepID=UPI001EDA0748|nr:energy transducer TonB [Massilia sp. TS11]MCG2582799.1 energy transducer TonB [Massilia sp. TS11]